MSAGDLPLHEGKMIFQFDAQYAQGTFYVVEKELRAELLSKENFRILQIVRDSKTKLLDGEPVPKKNGDLAGVVQRIFRDEKFKLHYEFERLAYRGIGSSTNERTRIAALIPARICFNHKLLYLSPCQYTVDSKGHLVARRCGKFPSFGKTARPCSKPWILRPEWGGQKA